MKLREIIKNKTILDDVSVFAQAYRDYDGSEARVSIGIYKSGIETRELYQLELDREGATKLIRELSAALDVPPYTPEEIEHHKAVVADRIEEGRYL